MKKFWAAIATVGLVTGSLVGIASTASADVTPLTVSIPDSISLGGTLTSTVTGGDTALPTGLQWLRNNAVIAGATAPTYTPRSADKGDTISLRASNGTTLVVSNSVVVSSGTLVSENPSVIAGESANFLGTFFAPNATYLIVSGTFTTSVVAAPDGTFAVAVPIAASTKAGTRSVVVSSQIGRVTSTTVAVVRPPSSPTMSAAAPSISGAVKVGVTVEANLGSWSPGTLFTYQWYRSGVAIAGSTSPRYAIQASDVKKTLKVRVVGTSDAATVTATSAAVKVAPATFAAAPTVTIRGVAKKGRTLKAVLHGEWKPGAVKTGLTWYVNGVKVSTAKTVKVKKSWKKKSITVKLTGSRPGYTAIARVSAAKKVS